MTKLINKRVKELNKLNKSVFSKRNEYLKRREERANELSRLVKSKFKVTSQLEESTHDEKMNVEVSELTYMEDEPGELSSYFKYKIVTKCKNLSRYKTGHEYVVYRKVNDFELFHSCFS